MMRPCDPDSAFLAAAALEESGDLDGAAAAYRAILAAREDHRVAVNLGTILYNRREFERAAGMYLRAVEAEPGYALGWFDLGNALDELDRMERGASWGTAARQGYGRKAQAAYRVALRIDPRYADAHYNLALAFERAGEARKALRHWLAYRKLDPGSAYSVHARGRCARVVRESGLEVVWRRPA